MNTKLPIGLFLVTLATLFGAVIFASTWTLDRLELESSPVARGASYAQMRGCTECHGNPENPLPDTNVSSCSDSNYRDGHPQYEFACADVMAYFETVRLFRTLDERLSLSPRNPLLEGESLARTYHCFQCHGYLGQGGFSNAGSLKGYIPGYFGEDFSILTENGNTERVREWIMHGTNSKMINTPILGNIAQHFFERQAVGMPSFKSLQVKEIETLVNYVIALNRIGPMNVDSIRNYGYLTMKNSH